MDLASTISDIRKHKGLSISELTQDIISTSTFGRYITGTTDLHSQSFIEILNRLHITLPELEFIANNYSNNEEKEFMTKIMLSFTNQDIDYLSYLKITCQQKLGSHNSFYDHMLGLIDILIARLDHKEIDVSDNPLYKYLIRTETWTRYELVLFSDSLIFWPPETVVTILKRAITTVSKLDKLNPYGLESFRLISNAITSLIFHHNYKNALYFIEILEQYQLRDDFIYEKLFLKLFTGFKLAILKKDAQVYQPYFDDCLAVIKILNLPTLQASFEAAIKDIKLAISK